MATTTVTTFVVSKSQNQDQSHSVQVLGNGGNNAITNSGMPHGLGLLTTVASLPPKYRSRYLNITTKSETPLDLSVKQISPQIVNDVPIAASFTEVYTEPSIEPETRCPSVEYEYTSIDTTTQGTAVVQIDHREEDAMTTNMPLTNTLDRGKSPITPPPTPTKRKLSEQSLSNDGDVACNETEQIVEQFIADTYTNPVKMAKTNENMTTKRDSTPAKPIKPTDTAPKTVKSQPPATKPVKNKATRKLKFDEETSSPVSGTIIRPLEDITDGSVHYSNGDIDPKYNIVEITEETKAELAAIKNVIGDYICKLCRLKFEDAFGLAQHRCACIVLLEYRCPECGKQFNCPANLASHRRWHKPKKEANGNGGGVSAASKKENRNNTNMPLQQQRHTDSAMTGATYACGECGKRFKRQTYLRKHQLTHTSTDKKCQTSKAVATITSTRVAAIDTASEPSITTTTHSGAYQAYRVGSSSGASLSSSSSSQHSYSGASTTHEDEVGVTYMVNGNSNSNGVLNNPTYDYDIDSLSDCSNSSTGYGRLQIVESGLTEEENIAAAALTNLRNCASVIQHTTLAH